MTIMVIGPVRFVFLNPETEVREKQRFISPEFHRQGQVHEMAVGHLEIPRRRQHDFRQAALFQDHHLKVVLVYLVVYLEQRSPVHTPFFFVYPPDTALFPEVRQAAPYLLFRQVGKMFLSEGHGEGYGRRPRNLHTAA
jgi:hypothetical protein